MSPIVHDELREPVAIVGLACKLPGATSPEDFWNLLEDGRSARSKVPIDRFNVDAFYHPDPDRSDSANVRYGHFLSEDVGRFDAPFFSIQPNEAISMDPQQRLVLETSYHALENAGMPMESIAGSRMAVYFGTSSRDYDSILTRDSEEPSKYIGTGIGTSLIANRVSWFFDLRGPSLAIDTGCSGSLVALHNACRAIQMGETDKALVGGVSLIMSPDVSLVHLSNMGFFSPDGYCFSFDERANGYSKGEGVAVVVLQKLSDAIRDGNTIRAVIRSTSCNQDGHTPGLTVPSIDAQVENIQNAYRLAGLDLQSTAYFEAHGTGTQVGDTVEAEAIYRTFQRSQDQALYVGALKSNIGHLEAASGVAGLIKSTLTLEHGVIPQNLHFRSPNPKIDIENWGLKFPLNPTPWPNEGLRRTSLNSFGYGGTNAHVILDDAAHYLELHGLNGRHSTLKAPSDSTQSITNGYSSATETNGHINGHVNGTSVPCINGNAHNSAIREPRIIVFSAADEASLKNMITTYQTSFSSLKKNGKDFPSQYLGDLSYTLSKRRSKLHWKSYAVVKDLEDITNDLGAKVSTPIRSSRPSGLLMVFSGQGAQYAQMGQELHHYPEFRNSLLKADTILKNLGSDWSLLSELAKNESESHINKPAFSQPICTALQLALVDLLTVWDILPSAVVGHSSGEIAAAYAVGALSFEDALKVAYFRGIVAEKLESDPSVVGAMSSIASSPEAIMPVLDKLNRESSTTRIQIGCVNSDKNVTVTGDAKAIELINEQMRSEGIFARRLAVTVPYHSTYMNAVADEYESLLSISTQPNGKDHSVIRMFSSVTGQEIIAKELRKTRYWVQNMVSTVLFSDAVTEMLEATIKSHQNQPQQILEVGPHSVLQRPIKDIVASVNETSKVSYESLLTRGTSAMETVAETIGRLYCKNVPIDVSKVRFEQVPVGQHLPDLPSYPFNHSTKYWHEGRISRMYRFKKHARHDFLGNRVTDWNKHEPRWRNVVRLSEHPWLQDHVIDGKIVYPSGSLLVMALEAVRQLCNEAVDIDGFEFSNVSFLEDLLIPEAGEVETQINLRSEGETYAFSIFAFENDSATLITQGTIAAHTSAGPKNAERLRQLFHDRASRCVERVDALQYYTRLSDMGYHYGSHLQKYPFIEYDDARSAFSEFQVRPKEAITDGYVIHPIDLEAILHSSFAAASSASTVKTPILKTRNIGRLWIKNSPLVSSVKMHAEMTCRGTFDANFSILALDGANNPVLQVQDLKQWATTSFATLETDSPIQRLVYGIAWKPDPSLATGAQIEQIMKESLELRETASGEDEDLQELISYHYVGLALKSFSAEEIQSMPNHLQKYMAWAEHIYSEASYQRLLALFPEFADQSTREEFESTQANRSSAIELHVATGRSLLPILKGEMDALDLLFKSGLAERYYANDMFANNYHMLGSYLDLLAHRNPELSILEVGAGTGGATRPIMRVLSSDNPETGISRFSEYMYTDVSPAFFERAKEMFRPHVGRLQTQILDIEKDVLSQGFTAKYDVVICSGVLHISAEMEAVLRNIRQLLKPGGKLMQFEPSNPDTCRAGFTFGLLKDWWVSKEEHRRYGPLISDEVWNETLLASGFSGTDVCIPTFPIKERQTHSILISTKTEEQNGVEKDAMSDRVIIVKDDNDDVQIQVAEQLQQSLGQRFASCITSNFSGLEIGSAWYIFLVELTESFLRHVDDSRWNTLKSVMDSARKVIWVTRGGGQYPQNPDMSIVTGFGRSMMTEKLGLDFMELALETSSGPEQVASRVDQIVSQRLTNPEALEPEYCEHKGRLAIGRLVAADTINDRLHRQLVQQQPVEEPIADVKSLKLAIAESQNLASLYFVDQSSTGKQLGPNEVLIRVKAATVSPIDVEIAMSQTSGTEFGLECAGIVAEAGSSSNFQINDRVCACLPRGTLATFVRADSTAVFRIPNGMSFEQAAELPASMILSYHGIVNLAGLRSGDSLLIAARETSVVALAVRIAKRVEATVLVAATNEEEKDTYLKLFNLLEEEVLVMDSSFSSNLRRRYDEGVDAVFTELAGEEKRTLLSCVAPFGRFIDISGSGVPAVPANVAYTAVDVVQLLDSKQGKRFVAGAPQLNMFEGIALGTRKQVFTSSNISKAFEQVQQNRVKTVVQLNTGDIVQIASLPTPAYKFDSNATYVVGGGNGGLGRAVAYWLAERGAKNIVILARSGASNEGTRLLLSDLQSRGINIHAPLCDLSDENAVRTVLEEVSRTMPPVKGMIQATMVLREGILDNLTADDWHATLAPKVQGTWNLHTHLPRDLDFFVCLSSVAGITGARSQAGYNAACTYQDSIVRYRHARGERAMTFNLGVIIGSGFAAATDKTEMLKREGYLGMPKTEFLAILEHCCDPSNQVSTPQQTQLVSGLDYMRHYKPSNKGEIYWARNTICAVLRQMNSGTISNSDDAQDDVRPGTLLSMATTQSEAVDVALQALVGKLSKLFNIPAADIDPTMPIYSIGIDSLVALEIRYWLMKELKADLAVAEVMKDQALLDLAGIATERSECRTSSD